MNRRVFVGAGASASMMGAAVADAAVGEPATSDAAADAASDTVRSKGKSGIYVPHLDLLYESEVTISAPLEMGTMVDGTRRVIPITGGHFEGPKLRGTVLPIGADWNLKHTDGTSSVEAAYYLKTDDGVLIRIVNKGVSNGEPPRALNGEMLLMFTAPTFEAPTGRYEWINHGTFVGTLNVRPGTSNAVFIRVFQVG